MYPTWICCSLKKKILAILPKLGPLFFFLMLITGGCNELKNHIYWNPFIFSPQMNKQWMNDLLEKHNYTHDVYLDFPTASNTWHGRNSSVLTKTFMNYTISASCKCTLWKLSCGNRRIYTIMSSLFFSFSLQGTCSHAPTHILCILM